jgi:L-alanine-DL-glutamate epimerase-like enolase superfamily enzyme
MRITGYRLGILRVPLRTPFKTALRQVDALEDVVLELQTDNGYLGYGEAPPTVAITGDSLESIEAGLRTHILPALMGCEVSNVEENCLRVQNAMPGSSSAKAAAEIALYDLHAQQRGLPLYQALNAPQMNASSPPELRTDLTISVNNTETMIADCELAIARGFSALKIKVGKHPETDIARLCAIHAAVAGRAVLRIDANQGWTASQTILVLAQLDSAKLSFDLIEQPVPAHDIDGMRAIKAANSGIPLMADESAFNLPQVVRLVECAATDIINIKLMKTGGLSGAIAISDYCATQQIPCMMGCMLEGSISVAAAAHLALAKSNTITRIDLDGPSLAAFDPIDSNVRFDDAVIRVSNRPGLGVQSVSHINWLN